MAKDRISMFFRSFFFIVILFFIELGSSEQLLPNFSRRRTSLLEDFYEPLATIHQNLITRFEAHGSIASADHGWDAQFTSHNRGV